MVDDHLRDMSSLTLGAVATAAGCSRLLARSTLQQWGLIRMADDSELVISELVTNAVMASGLTDTQPRWRELTNLAVIRVRLLLYDTRIIIDVWDQESTVPILKEAVDEDEYGRGLSIVDKLCVRWGYFYPQAGGKVVWAELVIPPHKLTLSGTLKRSPTPELYSSTAAIQSPELLCRVRDGRGNL